MAVVTGGAAAFVIALVFIFIDRHLPEVHDHILTEVNRCRPDALGNLINKH